MKVRILSATTVDGVVLPCDCTPDLPESMVKGLVSSGLADADPGAVAYAEKNGVAVPKGLPDYSKQVAAEAKAAKAEV
ncbi:MAG: hypothetical protein JWR00_4674 [Rubritepida sp.]|nr:hypothetical protein [Rubritepida sp.]